MWSSVNYLISFADFGSSLSISQCSQTTNTSSTQPYEHSTEEVVGSAVKDMVFNTSQEMEQVNKLEYTLGDGKTVSTKNVVRASDPEDVYKVSLVSLKVACNRAYYIYILHAGHCD